MFMSSLLADVLFDASASGSFRISCIENMDDDVRGVDDLVEFIPDPFTLALGEDGLPGTGKFLTICLTRIAAEQLCLVEPFQVSVMHFFSLTCQIFKSPDTHLDPLPLGLGAESITIGS